MRSAANRESSKLPREVVTRQPRAIKRSSVHDTLYTVQYKTLTASHGFLRHNAYWLSCIAGAFLFLLALPDDAAAAPAHEVHPGGTTLILPVERAANYVVAVSASEEQRVKLLVKRPPSTTEYMTTGHVTSRRIEADFGALGQVDVRLHLVRRPADPPHQGRCRGRAPLYQEGTYRGSIELSHQGDVPAFSIERGHVYFERRFRQVCKRKPQSAEGNKNRRTRTVEAGLLTLAGRAEGRTIFLQAASFVSRINPQQSAGNLEVAANETLEGVQVTQKISTPLDHGAFVMSPRESALDTAEITPPAPFAGNAIYARRPASPPSWTGDLTVELPNGSSVPLTGADFTAVFCRGFSMATLRRCLARHGPSF